MITFTNFSSIFRKISDGMFRNVGNYFLIENWIKVAQHVLKFGIV